MYCTQCGAELLDLHVEGRLRPSCPVCGQIAYRHLKVGAGVLIEREGALLLVKRGPESTAFAGAWNLPAGYCEADEPPPATAAREAAEETGLQVQVGRLVDAYFFDDDPRGNGLLLVYEAQAVDGDLEEEHWVPPSPGEVADAGFFTPDHLPEPLCGGGHDRAIEAWRKRALDRWQPGMPMRYCPHCTHALVERVAFDRVRPICLACGFVHFRDPKVGVSVLVEYEGQALLVQRAIEPGLGKWCLPSGFVEWDETPEAAAVRECQEETGLIIADLDLLEVTSYSEDFRGPGINLTYRASASGSALEPGDDAMIARWFAPSELPPPELIAFLSHQTLLWRWATQRLACIGRF